MLLNMFYNLTLMFIFLKLTNVIDWTWWLVLSPTLFNLIMHLFATIWHSSK